MTRRKFKKYCAVGFNTRFKLILLGRRRRLVYFQARSLGEVKGAYFEVNKKAIEYTKLFFDGYLRDSRFIKEASRSLGTSKYDCHIKKMLVHDFFDVLKDLYLVREFCDEKRIMALDTLPNRFAIEKFLKDNKEDFTLAWVRLGRFFWLPAFLYVWFHIVKTIFLNGVAFKNKTDVKLYKEAAWKISPSRPSFRDDFIIDNVNFKKDDIIFYSLRSDEVRDAAAKQLKDAGYKVVDLKRCSLNVRGDLADFFRIYLWGPLRLLATLFSAKEGYLIESMLRFYVHSFPHFLFLTNYRASRHISMSDHGETAETIIMNMMGCKNILYNWADMTSFKTITHAFVAHNVFYTWGPIHHDFQKEDYFYDRVENVGCVSLATYFDSLKNAKDGAKRILMCDEAFSDKICSSEEFYLDYLDLAIQMLNEVDAELIFKSKTSAEAALKRFSTEERRRRYAEKMKFLRDNKNFRFYDGNYQVETLIASSDVVVNMGMTSPATIALILGKDAVYYDAIGNDQHPMTRYRGEVVFADKTSLIERVKKILRGEDSVFRYIDSRLLNKYDSYRDGLALKRLREAISADIASNLGGNISTFELKR